MESPERKHVSSALVLVQNERTLDDAHDYGDVEGERYHYPNQYKNKVQPGLPFVYYRGVRRAGPRRAEPEYFGIGRVGRVWRDDRIPASEPKRSWRWFCDVEDYRPFPHPVPFRANGQHLEDIPHNHWGTGVRRLPLRTLQRIVHLANLSPVVVDADGPEEPEFGPRGPIRSRSVELGDVVHRRSSPSDATMEPPLRRSAFARRVGRLAEAAVVAHLRRTLPKEEAATVRWVADEGETPGWDVEHRTRDGGLRAWEVKGTQGTRFTSVELTRNEWEAAHRLRKSYALALVTRCTSPEPRIAVVRDPVADGGDRPPFFVPAAMTVPAPVQG